MKLFLSVLFLTLLLGCSQSDKHEIIKHKNYTTYRSKNIKEDKAIELKELFTLNYSDYDMMNPTSIKISDKKVYILDQKNNSICIFDLAGNFLSKFGRRGQGPGEFISARNMEIDNDSILVLDYRSGNIVYFDKSGNFIKNKNLGKQCPKQLSKLSPGKYIGINDDNKYEDNKLIFNKKVNIFNQKFEVAKNIVELENILANNNGYNPFNSEVIISSNNSNVFIHKQNSEKYLIEIFSFDGVKTGEIIRSYRKIKVTDSYKDQLKRQSTITVGGDKITPKINMKYRHVLYSILTDKYNNLWVLPNSSEKTCDLYIDNLLIGKLKLQLDIGKLYLENDKMIIVDRDKNRISLYDYNYKK